MEISGIPLTGKLQFTKNMYELYIYWLIKVRFKKYLDRGMVIVGIGYPKFSKIFCHLKALVKYYDCMDNRPALAEPYGENATEIREIERKIEQCADCIFVSSNGLRELSPYRKDAITVNNGINISDFNTVSNLTPPDLPIGKPIVGYCGMIHSWFYFEAIIFAATKRPTYNFIFIGPVTPSCKRILKTVTHMPNVFWLGQKPYDMLAQYIRTFDVCTIPFKVNEITRYVDPVKVYEYFAMGKPVIASSLPEVKKWQPFVNIYSSPIEFLTALDGIMSGQHPDASELRAIAKTNTWSHRAAVIHSVLEQHIDLRGYRQGLK